MTKLLRPQFAPFALLALAAVVTGATHHLIQSSNQTVEIQKLKLVREAVSHQLKSEEMLAAYIAGNTPNAVMQGNTPFAMQSGNFPNQIINGNVPDRIMSGNFPEQPLPYGRQAIEVPQPIMTEVAGQ